MKKYTAPTIDFKAFELTHCASLITLSLTPNVAASKRNDALVDMRISVPTISLNK